MTSCMILLTPYALLLAVALPSVIPTSDPCGSEVLELKFTTFI
jgi:hypothetical protein